MRLCVSNVGRIGEADIAIDGITVIAGENNTGKSTLGKALWCMFSGFHNLHSRLMEERVSRIARIVAGRSGLRLRMPNAMQRLGIEELITAFVEAGDSSPTAAEALIGEAVDRIAERHGDTGLGEFDLQAAVDEVVDAMETADGEIIAFFLDRLFMNEFNGQPRSLYSGEPARVGLTIRSEEATVSLYDNGIEISGNAFDLHAEAACLDDPFILDDVDTLGSTRQYYSLAWGSGQTSHRGHLQHLLQRPFGSMNALESIEASRQLSVIYERLAKVCDGEVVTSGRRRSGFFFVPHGLNDTLALGNLSSGLKTFVMISMLLSSGAIEKNGTIIFDEPEIHLHPAWQVQFAELVVLLQREFDLHVLLTCHSPYFIRAIETYSIKYGISDACHYYHATVDERGVASLTDVSDSMEVIYHALYLPLQDIENEQAYL